MSRIVSVNMEAQNIDPDPENESSLDDAYLNMIHDFGAGEGVDMRDFSIHNVIEESETEVGQTSVEVKKTVVEDIIVEDTIVGEMKSSGEF
jgi:hypothetical protein